MHELELRLTVILMAFRRHRELYCVFSCVPQAVSRRPSHASAIIFAFDDGRRPIGRHARAIRSCADWRR
jgi:hypothetical protein